MANQYVNPTKMTIEEFTAFCNSKGEEWTIKELHKVKKALANCRENCKLQSQMLFDRNRQDNAEKRELNILRQRADNFSYMLRKFGYKPRKLLIFYKESGCRTYTLSGMNCDFADCDECENHYENDCVNSFVLYDFCFSNGTTYDDYDGFIHSEFEGIDASLNDVSLSDVTKIVDMETNQVLFVRGDNNG